MSTSAPSTKTPVAPHGIAFLLAIGLGIVILLHLGGFRFAGTLKVGA